MKKYGIGLVVIIGLVMVIIGWWIFENNFSPVGTQQINDNGKSYPMAEVATHNSNSSCWSVVNGKVYDLTSWINQHPGGPEAITGMCGVDASAAFGAQHGGQRKPNNELNSFYIGNLAN